MDRSIPIPIRRLYTPTQPGVGPADDEVAYSEFPPDARLQPFIYCYWQLETLRLLDRSFVYRAVADGCPDLILELHRPQENFIMGFSDAYSEFPLGHQFRYVGVRFLPGTFPLIFRLDASELSNRFEHLGSVLPAVSRFLADHLEAGQTMGRIREILDGFFLRALTRAKPEPDMRLYQSIRIILETGGALDVEKELDTGISPRQLRRLFRFYVGDTPKSLSRIVRFQRILREVPSLQSLRENKLFFDAGYYDQAHFIKDFKRLYGTTPGRAFRGEH